MADAIPTALPDITDAKLFPWWLLLVWGILTLLIGCMLLAWPGMTTILLITLMGAYWFVGGLFALGALFVDRSNMGWKLFLAIINIIAGIVILCYPLYATVFVLSFFVIFVGFWACFIGVAHIYQAFSAKDAGNGVLGFISIIFGLLLLVAPMYIAALLPFIAGAFAIVMGIIAIAYSFAAKKAQAVTAA